VKGWSGVGKPLIGKTTTNNRLRVPLTMLYVDTGKETIYGRLRTLEPGPGFIHFPRTVDVEYFRQLVSERIEKRFSKGVYSLRWVKIHSRNEALDCAVYALGAYHLLNPNMEKVKKNFILSLPTKEDRSETEKSTETESASSLETPKVTAPEPVAEKVEEKKIDLAKRVNRRPARPSGWVNNWRR
jgi:phage terminase large subunit GpA-like protein